MSDKKPPPDYRKAVALTYDGERAPFVSATGKGLIADEILKVAQEHGILIHEDRALLAVLAELDLGQEIPRGLYQAIAEIIAFAYSLKIEKEEKEKEGKAGRQEPP